MRLKAIFLILTTVPLLLVLIAGVALDMITTKMHHGLLDHGRTQTIALLAEKTEALLRDSSHFNALWVVSRDGKFLSQREAARSAALGNIRRIQALEQNGSDRALVSGLEQATTRLFAVQDRIPYARSGLIPFEILRPQRRSLDQALQLLDQLSRSEEAGLRAIEMRSRNDERLSNWIARSAEAASVLLIAGMIVILYSGLFTPLEGLILAISRYRNGDREVRMPLARLRIDELRQATQSFNALADKLNELEQQRSRFLAGTVHDLRNPLTALRSVASLLKASGSQTRAGDRSRLLSLIVEQVDQLRSLVDDLVDRQQVQSGSLKLRLEAVDLGELLEDVALLWQAAAPGHQISASLPREPLVARCDPGRIKQSMNNLLSNAIKYSPRGGQVEVALRPERGFAAISVSDQGAGIPPEDRERIFEPYMRGSRARDQVPGTGLGLSSTRKIIEAHGGEIALDSRPGWGTVFQIRIPLEQAMPRTA